MNFDELKKQWDQQGEKDDFVVNPNLNHYKSVGNILVKLRRNIKSEFIVALFAMLFLLVLPYISTFHIVGYVKLAYYFLIFQLLLASVFYYKRFFYFYKSTKQFELLTSRENLLKLYYDLKFSIETYKMSTYMIAPQVMLLYLILFSGSHTSEWIQKIYHISDTWQQDYLFTLFMGVRILGTLVLMVVVTEMMIYAYYGKYLKQIKKSIDALEEE